ncbi:MAG: pyruvate/2-oxoglutarate dehydrogenase complex, dihydrolipoamide acyltransferase (E2) component [Pseudorhodobacter sp. PARRP1]|nr:MAG: pyruvate/2-oxoglutarate dehydrogenase complex, dihydrolipoamide acyltransferase (E2) component [Pseudorhodobacter sp. PARRP1]
MRSARVVFAIAGAALLALTACSEKTPELMNLRSDSNGPDEFAILPPKALELPTSLAKLPAPTPGGANLTDQNPQGDAIAALGGAAPSNSGISDAGLYNYATRQGVTPGIRQTLAAEDLDFRKKHNGRPLERLFNMNVYYKAYARMSLDQHAELARWRAAGARTPSAPPRKKGE